VGYRCGRVALYERNYCLQVDSSQKHAHLSPNAPRAPRKLHVPGSNAVEIKPRADRRALIGCAASVRSRCAVSVARTTRSLASDNCLDTFSGACSICPTTMASRVASALAGDAGVSVAGRPSGTQVLRTGVDPGAYFFTFFAAGLFFTICSSSAPWDFYWPLYSMVSSSSGALRGPVNQ
jgi:hypothetical protein